LWIGFLGAAIAAREGKLLALATGTFLPSGRVHDWASAFASAVAASMATVLAWGGVQLALSEREAGSIIAAGVPVRVRQLGAAVLLFMSDGVTPATVLIETYSLSVSPTLPAIPLFTLAGFILAEGHASARLLRVFRAWFGWIPGGTAVVCAILCTFFTAFTG